MSRHYESQCVGCSDTFGGCMGRSCPNYEIEVTICDKCGYEINDGYEYDGADYCSECLLEVLIEEGVIEECSM